MGFNSPEWCFAFLGTIYNNNIASGIYATSGRDACLYQTAHSEAEVVVVENLAHCEIYFSILDKLPEVKAVVAWSVKEFPEAMKKDGRFHRFNDFIKLGANVPDSVIEEHEARNKPGKCCTILYTSGTTGNPKGVMLSHDSVLANYIAHGKDYYGRFSDQVDLKPEDVRQVSFLPLNHIAAFGFDVMCTILWGS